MLIKKKKNTQSKVCIYYDIGRMKQIFFFYLNLFIGIRCIIRRRTRYLIYNIIHKLWKYFIHEISKGKFHFRYSTYLTFNLLLTNLKQIISVFRDSTISPFFVTTSSMEYCSLLPLKDEERPLWDAEERKTRRGNGKRATPAFDIPLDRSSRPRLEVWIIGREERHPLSNGIRAWCGASKVRQRELSVTR